MSREPIDLELKMSRSVVLPERRIDGWQYENERGKIAWHVRTWPHGDPIEDYWVEGGEFYEVVGLHYAVNMLPLNRIETGRRITGMDAAKREAILNAISGWENSPLPEIEEMPRG
jgi:hypothetical protein